MAFTDDQNAAIKSAYTQAKLNNDPQGLMKQMTDFGVDVNGISGATGYSNQEIGNWLSASGAPKGFGGYTAPDNMYDGWNCIFWSNWSDSLAPCIIPPSSFTPELTNSLLAGFLM